MRFRWWTSVAVVGLFVICGLSCVVGAQDKATPEQVIKKTQEAAGFMAKAGEAGLADFDKADGQWVFKDTYVFVFNCGEGQIVGHPVNQKLVGKNMMGLKDIKGSFFFGQMCDASKKPKGGWVEYWWPKPNETEPSRKLSYMVSVPNSPYQVGSGIYNDKVSLETLESLLKL